MSSSRKKLPHEIPLWINQSEELYFITICASKRGINQFCDKSTSQMVFDSIKYYQEQKHYWEALFILLMPDHIHAIFTFPQGNSISKIITTWKHYVARKTGIEFQRDFFEHRIRRNSECAKFKFDYIRNNPNRAGLIDNSKEWPYVIKNGNLF